MWHQENLQIPNKGRGSIDITAPISRIVAAAAVHTGLCHVFVRHTSASLMLCENADPTVRSDLEAFMQRTVPDGDTVYRHTSEGPDDMPAHVRSVLTQSGLSIPIVDGRLGLGTWQGIYLWEHRLRPHTRQVVVTVQGE